MPSSKDLNKQFIKSFNGIAYNMHRHDVFRDFMEMAYCAIAKTTSIGERADELEGRYMAIVKRHKPDDIRKMPELLGIVGTALSDDYGRCDFLGQVVGELELLNSNMGQFFSPYEICSLMAGMQLGDVGEIITAKGFVTVSEPACGAGGMILAAADVIAGQGFDIGQTLYADCTDLSSLCFHMAYVQLSLRGIPAMVRRGNSLSLEMFERARTPALLPFLLQHGNPFKGQAAEQQPGEPATSQPARPPDLPEPGKKMEQLSLF